jgi:hypothetical protein
MSPRYARAAGFSDIALAALVRFTSDTLLFGWDAQRGIHRKDRIMLADRCGRIFPSCHSLDFLLRRRLAVVVRSMMPPPSLSSLA